MDEAVDLRLVRKDPGKAYITNMLWLPKDGVRVAAVQDALQYWRDSKDGPVLEKLWMDAPHHVVVPREFITTDQYLNYVFPFIDVSPQRFPRVGVEDNIILRDNQQEAWAALEAARGGILNLACGKGKTVLALKKIAALGAPALVVVNDGLQYDQWKRAIAEHLAMPFGEEIGTFQGQNRDWKRPITVAIINTLAACARDGSLPEGFSDWFGSVWFDEVHHLSAPLFVIRGLRFGLTATADRLDQLQWIYNYHVGGVFFTDLSQDLIPQVFFQKTPSYVDLESKEARDKRGEINISRLRSFLGDDAKSLQFRYHCIKEALDSGRKILAIGHSVTMLKELHSMFPGSGLVIGSTPHEQRMDIVRESRLCFAIAKLGKEALDDAHLDALFVLTPFSSPNDLQQLLGRIQRYVANKLQPVAVIFDDVKIGPLHYLTVKLRKTLKKRKIPFTTLDAPAF
jgi:superfamily II DNA or RNA helicase